MLISPEGKNRRGLSNLMRTLFPNRAILGSSSKIPVLLHRVSTAAWLHSPGVRWQQVATTGFRHQVSADRVGFPKDAVIAPHNRDKRVRIKGEELGSRVDAYPPPQRSRAWSIPSSSQVHRTLRTLIDETLPRTLRPATTTPPSFEIG